MTTATEQTRTYIATRDHPKLGLLVKIGVSKNPASRCAGLRARRVRVTLPSYCEADLKALLHPHRVWHDHIGDDWRQRTGPIYSARTEWFFATDDVKRLIDDYIDAQQARA
jgi:hypothetical protein